MTWTGSLSAKVVRGRHDASTEQLLPDPIDRDACRERILGREDPARQGKAVPLRVGRQRRQNRWHVFADGHALATKVAANVDVVLATPDGALGQGLRLRQRWIFF